MWKGERGGRSTWLQIFLNRPASSHPLRHAPRSVRGPHCGALGVPAHLHPASPHRLVNDLSVSQSSTPSLLVDAHLALAGRPAPVGGP